MSPSNGAGPNIAAITLLFELGADPTRSYKPDIWSETHKKLLESVCREQSSPAAIVQHLDTVSTWSLGESVSSVLRETR